jgi:hypothetical protein
MKEFNEKVTVNSLCLFLALLLVNIWYTNHNYLNIILQRIYSMDWISIIIITNSLGLLLILYKLSIDIEIKFTIKYK